MQAACTVFDRDEGLFHLTTLGWVRADEEPFPPERLETWRYAMVQGSAAERPQITLFCTWAARGHVRSKRDELRRWFGWPHGLTPTRDTAISEPL